MKETLIAAGWIWYYTCRCSGTPEERFNHPEKVGWKINIKPKKNTFKAKKNNSTVKEGYNYQLAEYLKTI